MYTIRDISFVSFDYCLNVHIVWTFNTEGTNYSHMLFHSTGVTGDSTELVHYIFPEPQLSRVTTFWGFEMYLMLKLWYYDYHYIINNLKLRWYEQMRTKCYLTPSIITKRVSSSEQLASFWRRVPLTWRVSLYNNGNYVWISFHFIGEFFL